MKERLLVRVLFAIAGILAPTEHSEAVRNLANHVNQSDWTTDKSDETNPETSLRRSEN